MTFRRRISALLVAGIGTTLSAQTVQPPRPAFEVASIKKRDSPARGLLRPTAEHGTFAVAAASAAYLVQFAYDVRDELVVDGPEWLRTDLFEVNAKAGWDASRDEMRPMMQSLLAERFGLVVRREPRVMPHFELVPAHEDGRLGPGMQKVDDCRNPETRPKGPSVPSGAVTTTGCGTIASLANGLATGWVGAPVVDRTGIPGTFHHFWFSSPAEIRRSLPGLPPLQLQVSPEADALPLLRDALRDQLGLRLQAVRGPLDVLVIESIHQPTEN